MPSSFELFKQQIDSAVDLIEKTKSFEVNENNTSVILDGLVDTQSLLARCEKICEKYESKKPTIRIVHHLACSGGSLISKCISAMPNVFLLSEVHPYTSLSVNKDAPMYSPTDITSLVVYAGIPDSELLAKKIFKQSIDEVYRHVEKKGGVLVLRDHTHADFNVGNTIKSKTTLKDLLKDDYNIKSILTFRDPIDSYESLVRNKWLHFEPNDFDEYCSRALELLSLFQPEQIFKYEDFLENPNKQMKNMMALLDIEFDDTFSDIFDIFKVTGDSGRKSNFISARSRTVSDDVILSRKSSIKYKEILNRYGLY